MAIKELQHFCFYTFWKGMGFCLTIMEINELLIIH